MIHRVFIDGCAVNRFATINVDPARELAGTPFELALTPALEEEYRQALAHRRVEPHIKALLRTLLAAATSLPVEEFVPNGRTTVDADLIALSTSSVVVTDDRKAVWTRAANPGLILWRDVEAAITRGVSFLDLVQKRAAKLR
jgi:hypothetical protein